MMRSWCRPVPLPRRISLPEIASGSRPLILMVRKSQSIPMPFHILISRFLRTSNIAAPYRRPTIVLHGYSVTAFATLCYAAGVHVDEIDLGHTVGIRAFRPEHEPKAAYQFVYTSFRRLGSPSDHHGVIMSQLTGSIILWDARKIYHVSFLDVPESGEIPTGKGDSVNMMLVQNKPMFFFLKKCWAGHRIESWWPSLTRSINHSFHHGLRLFST